MKRINTRCSIREMIITLISLILFALAEIHACNVPVFRYALERWPADVYTVLVYTDGNLEYESLSLLRKYAIDVDSLSNFRIQTIDITSNDGARVAQINNIAETPWMQLYYPPNAQVRGLVWEGQYNEANVRRLVDSPSRAVLAKKLLGGDVAIWLFLNSGSSEKDNRARNILQRTVSRAEKELKIPSVGVDINGNPVQVDDFVDYTVHFDIIEVDRENPTEQILLAMLLGSESDLIYYDEPMVFPVFGRGRALYAIVGEGITEQTVYEACRSVTAWCSCEIKAQHPGIDLLITTDWSQLFGGTMVQDELPPLIGLDAFVPPPAESTQASDTISSINLETKGDSVVSKADTTIADSIVLFAEDPVIAESSNPLVRNVIGLAVVLIILILISTLILKSKKRESNNISP